MEITEERLINAGFKISTNCILSINLIESFNIYVSLLNNTISTGTSLGDHPYVIKGYSEELLNTLYNAYTGKDLDFEEKVYTRAEKYWYDDGVFPDTDITDKSKEQFSFNDMIEFANDYAGFAIEEYNEFSQSVNSPH